MKILRLVVVVAGGLFLGVLSSSAAGTKSEPVKLGDNTYSIERHAATTFNRDVDQFANEAREAAEQFCAAQGKKMKVLSMKTERPFYTLGYARATLTFMAVDPNAPDSPAPPESAASPSGATTNPGAAPADTHSPTGDLYNDLLKLDDLRKRGILTDKEFQKEKKKLLDRER